MTRISLKGLGRDDTARLLERTLGTPAPDELIDRVHEETAGNPLFAGEIGRLLAGEGQLDRAGGEGLPIPQGVKEAIGLRLERQSAEARDLLARASALGREFDLDALEGGADWSRTRSTRRSRKPRPPVWSVRCRAGGDACASPTS